MEIRKTIVCFSALLLVIFPAGVFAAGLSFSPWTLSLQEGDTVSVALSVNANTAMNAVSGTVAFPSELLEVISLSNIASIVRFWVEGPAFSNTRGEVLFAGVVPNPGFSGDGGNILSVLFRAKKRGSGTLSYSAASVLANDGKATELLSQNQKGVAQVVVEAGVPALAITSPTHPDTARWYADTTATFAWTLPLEAVEVRTIISENPAAEPTVPYLPPIATKTVAGLSDGTQYFGLMLRDSRGWSDPIRFRVNVDTTPPKLLSPSVVLDKSRRTAIASFIASDMASGVSRYDMFVNGLLVKTFQPSEPTTGIELPRTHDGSATLTVIAYDSVGNSTTASATYESFAPEAGISDTVSTTGAPSGFRFSDVTLAVAVYAASVLFTAVLVSILLFGGWIVWQRMRKTPRFLLPRFEATDRRLHQELLDVRKAGKAEIVRLKSESKKRELTADEQMSLKQLSTLVEDVQHAIHREMEE